MPCQLTAAGWCGPDAHGKKYTTFEIYARAVQKLKLSYRNELQEERWLSVCKPPAAPAHPLYLARDYSLRYRTVKLNTVILYGQCLVRQAHRPITHQLHMP